MKFLLAGVVSLIATATCAAEITPEARRSGYDFAAAATRAMQDDDTANPGMLWVLQGETLWGTKAGAAEQSCADCHGDARSSMKGVAARYPAFDLALVCAAEELVRDHCLSDTTWQLLAQHYSRTQLMELVFLVGEYAMTAMATNSFGIPIDDDAGR